MNKLIINPRAAGKNTKYIYELQTKIKHLEDAINRALTIYDMDKLDDIIGSGHAMANILKKALEK